MPYLLSDGHYDLPHERTSINDVLHGLSKLMKKSSPDSLKVFLCHGSQDKPRVRKLYQYLLQENVDPWLDEENLLPGQDWEQEIIKAVRDTDVILVCLSPIAANKTGFVQKEIKTALDVADLKPPGTIFIIPVRLEECRVPDRLSKWHWVDLFDEQGYSKLKQALSVQAQQLQKRIEVARKPDEVIEDQLISLSKEYERLRATMPSGPVRTNAMTAVVEEMIPQVRSLRSFDLEYHLNSSDAGLRLLAYAYLYARPDFRSLGELIECVTQRETKRFSQYWSILAIRKVIAAKGRQRLDPAHLQRLEAFLPEVRTDGNSFYELNQILNQYRPIP